VEAKPEVGEPQPARTVEYYVRAPTLPTLRIRRVFPQHATKKQPFHEGHAALAGRGVQTCLQFPRERWRQVYGMLTIYVCYFAVASCIAYGGSYANGWYIYRAVDDRQKIMRLWERHPALRVNYATRFFKENRS